MMPSRSGLETVRRVMDADTLEVLSRISTSLVPIRVHSVPKA